MLRSLSLLLGLAVLLSGRQAQAAGASGEIVFDFAHKPKYGFFEKSFDYRGGRFVDKISFSINYPFRAKMAERLIDSTGQTFQRDLPPASEAWYPHICPVESDRWTLHFGGVNDGIVHHPIRTFQVIIQHHASNGVVRIRDVVFHEQPTVPFPAVKLTADVSKAQPPTTMKLELRADRGDFPGGLFAARFYDWDGNRLGSAQMECPAVVSGAVWTTELPYAKRSAGKNAIFCKTVLKSGEELLKREGPAWTAPLTDPLPPEKRSDLKWGTGIYLQRWGFSESSFRKMEQLVALARMAGIKWLREQIVWGQVVKSGIPDFSNYDRILTICETNGMSICMLFGGVGKGVKFTDADFCEKYCAALRESVRRYRGRVAVWEICNEPNLPWPMDPKWAENYRRLLGMATKVVHEEDPAAKSVGCSASGLGVSFVRSLANEPFDDVSIHPYRRFVDEREFLADLDELYAAGRNRDIWMTEIGWDAFPGFTRAIEHFVEQHEYAALMARAYMTTAAHPGLRAVFGYDFVDDGLLAAGFEYHMGVIHSDLSPKAAYRALAKVCRTFNRGTPKLEVRPDGFRIFKMGARRAVWTSSDVPCELKLDERLPATNLMDEPVEPESRDGKFVYSLDRDHPLFF